MQLPDLVAMQATADRPALPILLRASSSWSLSGLRVVLDQRGWPRAAIPEGPASDDADRLALFVATEFEEPVPLPRTKQGIEWLHLAKARHDLERRGLTDLSGTPRFGRNPPDFVVGDSPAIGVELAQLTQVPRRVALSLLRAVRRAVLQAPKADFAHLRDRLVMVGFDDPSGLPPKNNDERAIQEVLERLKQTDPGPAPKTIPETIDQNGFVVALVNWPPGPGATASFPLPMLPRSELARTRGFEIAASFTAMIRAGDTEAELARITAAHDAPANDILLISAGAPSGADGFPLVADEVSVEPCIAKTIRMPQPKQIRRILLHRWSFGDVYELFPEYRTLVESEISSGGPHVVPVPSSPDWVWSAPCPCGNGHAFGACHGATR